MNQPFPVLKFYLLSYKVWLMGSEYLYSITCIPRPLKGSNESGLLQQVVFEYRFY